MSPPRKNPITNQDSTRIITQQDPILPPTLPKGPTGYKPFFDDTHLSNKTKDMNNDSTYNSHTANEYSVNNLNVKKDKDTYD